MMRSTICLLAITAVLAGCSTLPRDGPSGRAIDDGATTPEAQGAYAIVPLDYTASEIIKAVPVQFLGTLAEADSDAPTDLIGVGDTLAISIFEPSGTLFGGGGSQTRIQAGNQSLPPITVDRQGRVAIPFGGQVNVQGLSSGQAADAIRRALIGRVANPQVVVSVADRVSSAVTVLGEVSQPGRRPLSVNSDRILDIIAAAGGPSRPIEDVVVAVQRQGQTFTAPLSAVTTQFDENVRLRPGDQVNLRYQPRRFSTFGALNSIRETEMGPGEVTLATALGRVGGLNAQQANARSVLVFRFERPEVARALGVTQTPTPRGVPIVYRLNLAEGGGFFVASNFEIEPDDVVYVSRAGAAEARTFFEFVQSFTRVIYDISVTSTLNR
jgi:polysaccharide export outer membrane protein